MLGKLAELYVEVGTKDNTAVGLSRIRSQLGQWTGAMRSALAIPVTIGTAAATAAVGKFLYDSAQAASDLNETMSKVGVVFGQAAGEVTGFADEMADKFGLVKREVLDAAASFGLVLQASGLTRQASAALSVQLAKLAADASSFYNVPIADALEKIRAALVGEAEPIRAFGVLLSEDAVKAKAAAMGFTELTDATKSLARAQIIVEGLTAASGDLERTQSGLANRQRQLAGDFANLQAEIGQGLVPIMQDLIELAYDWAGAIEAGFGDQATRKVKVFGESLEEARSRQRREGVGNFAEGMRAGLRNFLNPFADAQDIESDIGRDVANQGLAEQIDAQRKAERQQLVDAATDAFRKAGVADADVSGAAAGALLARVREEDGRNIADLVGGLQEAMGLANDAGGTDPLLGALAQRMTDDRVGAKADEMGFLPEGGQFNARAMATARAGLVADELKAFVARLTQQPIAGADKPPRPEVPAFQPNRELVEMLRAAGIRGKDDIGTAKEARKAADEIAKALADWVSKGGMTDREAREKLAEFQRLDRKAGLMETQEQFNDALRDDLKKSQGEAERARDQVVRLREAQAERLARGGMTGDLGSTWRTIQNALLDDTPKQQLRKAEEQVRKLDEMVVLLRRMQPAQGVVLQGPA